MTEQSRNEPDIELDKTDLYILTILTDDVLWKQRVAERLQEIGQHDIAASVQTVGRRISQLAEHGYLQPCIVEPADLGRNLVTAYKTTAEGQEAIERYRVCRTCGAVLSASDHVHDLEPAPEFFAAQA